MAQIPISLVIITLNEEHNIERCIRSVPFAQDVMVLDSGSSDRTLEIAKKLGARVKVEPWRGYQKQKMRVTALALNDWVLSLDADEALSVEAQKEILVAWENGLHEDGYEFPRLSYHMGRWIRHGGWYPDLQLRFFNRQKATWSPGHVHERVITQKVGRFKSPLYHWVFQDLADQVNTNNEYSSLGALDLLQKKKSFSLFKLLTKPLSKFLETYFWKRGFLDGLPGLVIAVGAAYSVFLKHAKHWEHQKIKRTPIPVSGMDDSKRDS